MEIKQMIEFSHSAVFGSLCEFNHFSHKDCHGNTFIQEFRLKVIAAAEIPPNSSEFPGLSFRH